MTGTHGAAGGRSFGPRAGALCARLRVRHPIIQAPMAGGWTTPELVAAVSNAGGLGMLAAARTTTEQLERAMEEIRARTDRPFGVNFLLAPPEPEPPADDWEAVQHVLDAVRRDDGLDAGAPPPPLPPSNLYEQLDAIERARVPIVSFAMGAPGPLVQRARGWGATVIAAATTVEEAVALETQGVDVVVAQGAEAGGHRSTFAVSPDDRLPLIGTMVLVPRVCDAVRVPVVASGGIMDGRGVAAALVLGASGVQMGTRFLQAVESGAFPRYRERIATARPEETTVTWTLTGRPARTIVNRLVEAMEASDVRPLAWPHQARAAQDLFAVGVGRDEPAIAPLLAGQGAGMVRAVKPAAAIVEELLQDVARALAFEGRAVRPGSEEAR